MKKTIIAATLAALSANTLALDAPSTETVDRYTDTIGMTRTVKTAKTSYQNCGSAVQVNGSTVVVNPMRDSVLDTDNLQCAINTAQRNDIRLVQIKGNRDNDQYFMVNQPIVVEGWTGEIQGVNMDKTLLIGQSEGPVFEVINSNLKISRMEIRGEMGIAMRPRQSRINSCQNDVSFLNVDRVSIESAYGVTDVGVAEDGCDSLLLGQLTVNRSEFDSGEVGVFVANAGAGFQLNSTFNYFYADPERRAVQSGLVAIHSSVTANVSGNEFAFGEWSVYMGSDLENERPRSSWSITKNKVLSTSKDKLAAIGVYEENTVSVDISSNNLSHVFADSFWNNISIINNNFSKSRSEYWDVSIDGATATVTANNRLDSIRLYGTFDSTVNQPGVRTQYQYNENLLSR